MALVAFVQARAALRDAGKAETARDEAVKAQQDAVEALGRANSIAEEALAAQKMVMPAPWGQATHDAGSGRFAVANTSGRAIVVRDIDLADDTGVQIFNPPFTPVRVEYGDVLHFYVLRARGATANGNPVTLAWHYEGEPDVTTVSTRRF